MRLSAIGRVKSLEHRRKISESLVRIGHKPPNPTGRVLSNELKMVLSEAHRGKRHSDEAKRKIGLSASLRNRGSKSNLWKGGVSYNPYPNRWNETLKKTVRERDSYTCQLCKVTQSNLIGRFKKLDVHHIDYNKENCESYNLISLCKACHQKTNFQREEWIEIFKKNQVV